MLRTIQLTFLAAGLVAMSALAASAAQNPHSAQSGAKPTKQMSSGANANGTAQNRRTSKSKWEHVLKEAQKPARTSRRARSIALPRVVAAQVQHFRRPLP
jgi:hypothetical protein